MTKGATDLTRGVARMTMSAVLACMFLPICRVQDQPQSATNAQNDEATTSTDFFIMLGSDFVRPGLQAKANYNIGIGHSFDFLNKNPLGNELTFAYTYEDAGANFWHSDFGSHTESFGG
jgi:hypothetical protein